MTKIKPKTKQQVDLKETYYKPWKWNYDHWVKKTINWPKFKTRCKKGISEMEDNNGGFIQNIA